MVIVVSGNIPLRVLLIKKKNPKVNKYFEGSVITRHYVTFICDEIFTIAVPLVCDIDFKVILPLHNAIAVNRLSHFRNNMF